MIVLHYHFCNSQIGYRSMKELNVALLYFVYKCLNNMAPENLASLFEICDVTGPFVICQKFSLKYFYR